MSTRPDVDVEGGNDFLVETKGRCFLCLIKLEAITTKEDQDQSMMNSFPIYSSFQRLSHYLRMDLTKLLNIKQGALIPLHLLCKVERSRLKVTLCQPCSFLSETFSELFREMERIELELVSCVRRIHGKLVTAEETGLAKEFQELTKYHHHFNLEEEGEADKKGLEIAQALRKEALLKCSKKLRSVPAPVPAPNKINLKDPLATGETEEDVSEDCEILEEEHQIKTASADGRILIKMEAHRAASSMSMMLENDDDDEEDQSSFLDYEDPNYEESEQQFPVSSIAEEEEEEEENDEDDKPQFIKPIVILSGMKKLKCGLCSKTFSSNQTFRSHYRDVHLKDGYKCNLCDREFQHRQSYSRHNLRVHRRGRGGSRKEADKNGRAAKLAQDKKVFSNLPHHSKTVGGGGEEDEPENGGDLEDEDQDVVEELESGKKYSIITGPPPKSLKGKPPSTLNPTTGKHKCSLCPLDFKYMDSFKDHFKSVHLKQRYRCNLCRKDFCHRQSYHIHHRNVHMGVRFKCRFCKNKFTQKSYLNEHLKKTACAVAREKDEAIKKKVKGNGWECPRSSCGKSFGKASDLQKHFKTVHVQMFPCGVCGNKFNRKSNLKIHQSRVHSSSQK